MQVASHRLIDAAAGLAPGDRALLSLLINHGLDDHALARVMHASPEDIASRRGVLAQRLGTLLELPPANVQEALAELAGSARHHRAEVEPSAGIPPRGEGNHRNSQSPVAGRAPPEATATETKATEAVATEPAAGLPDRAQPAPRPGRPRRGRRWLALAVVLLVVVIVIGIASSGSGSNQPSHSAAQPTKPAAAPTQSGSTSSQPATPVLAHGSLVPLPGGVTGATGTVALIGSQAKPQLKLTISGLPVSHAGGYELWLYNSVIDSVALAHLSAPNASLTAALPADYRRYRWLDVSLQSAGAVNHSGLSVLRAATPR